MTVRMISHCRLARTDVRGYGEGESSRGVPPVGGRCGAVGVSAVLSGRIIFGRDTRHDVSG
jgi:hypothetical protein